MFSPTKPIKIKTSLVTAKEASPTASIYGSLSPQTTTSKLNLPSPEVTTVGIKTPLCSTFLPTIKTNRDNSADYVATAQLRKMTDYGNDTQRSFSKKIVKENRIVIKNYAVKSKAGVNYEGKQKINQDSYLIKTNIFGLDSFSLFGVYDGHGSEGHFASNEVKNSITSFFTNLLFYQRELKKHNALSTKVLHRKYISNNNAFLKEAYFFAEAELSKTKINVNFSGTTAVTIVLLKNKLLCLNAGDSRALLVNLGANDKFDIVPLSKDHKAELADERQRIEKSGGRIEQFKGC